MEVRVSADTLGHPRNNPPFRTAVGMEARQAITIGRQNVRNQCNPRKASIVVSSLEAISHV